jgi:UPF0716 protein FxsA
MFFFILFIVWVAAELFVIVRVAEAIGVLLTLVLLIAAWPLGAWAMRSEGRVVWRHFNAAIAEGRPPGREVVDGVLVALGGVLLMVPGFISDAFGLLLLFPPTRVLLRAGLVRNFQHRIVAAAGRFGGGAGPGRPRPRAPSDVDGTVDGTATEVDPPQLRP